MKKLVLGLVLSAALSMVACSSSGSGAHDASGPGASGGAQSGGASGSATGGGAGGTSGASGGAAGTGGAAGNPTGSGGTVGTGGAPATGGSGGGVPDAGPSDGGPASAWPAVTDFAVKGSFPTQRENNVGPGAAYDVFRPAQLGGQGRKHPIVSWNNGTLYAIDRYQALLEHWASHGFVVMGGHTNTTAGGAIHKGAIDWLVAENARSGSTYFGMLDVKKIGVSGHSQGGGASISAGSMAANGIITAMPLMPIMSYQRPELARQAGSMLIVSATQDTRSTGVADQAFADVTKEFVDAEFIGVHEDAMSAGIHGATVAWLRYQLMGDLTAKAQFYPPATCALCKDTAWMRLRQKNSP
ncbi:MAG TPA: hypothetical protein VFH73_24335 [Polyangia bacterium]|jgi:hypothetical protein|nr:hypothetical protein [Polyangia bacterium]